MIEFLFHLAWSYREIYKVYSVDVFMKTLIWVLIGVILGLAIAGILTYSNNCYNNENGINGLGMTCETRIYGIKISEVVTMNNNSNNQLVGGCAGVQEIYQAECCENWAEENDIVHAQCIGEWKFNYEDNRCGWECSIS